ncbi:IS5 family transposase, partial [Pseudomonas syringae]
QHSAGAASTQDQAIGKSRAGNTSKIYLAVDACGLPIAFDVTAGQTNECSQAASLIAKVPDAEVIIADKGYDTEAIRAQVEQQGSKVVIPRKRNSLKGNADLDKGLYRNRHLVENAFARLKHFRAVASRFDKLKRNYESVIAMVCAFLWLPM